MGRRIPRRAVITGYRLITDSLGQLLAGIILQHKLGDVAYTQPPRRLLLLEFFYLTEFDGAGYPYIDYVVFPNLVTFRGGSCSVCTEDAYTMCLVNGRYRVTSHWRNQYAGGATATLAKAKLTDVTGAFWIADANTYEYMIRLQPGQSNGRTWIAIPTFTDVEFWVAVTDTVGGQSKEYHSDPGNRTLIYDPFFFVYP